jgi:single-strand DNA-binding protein
VNCTSFGKTGELIEKYVAKGDRIGLVGRVQTGSYEKDGKKVYVTNIIGERVEFLNNKNENNESNEPVAEEHPGFSKLTEEDIPF